MSGFIPMPTENDEKILCAAIYIDDDRVHPHQPKNIKTGFVIGGFRHCNILGTLQALNYQHDKNQRFQGFLTTKNRFVSRSEAKAIADAKNQCIKYTNFYELFSEDLY